MKLRGELAVVTGAAMGMGKSVSRLLLEAGCAVALVDVKEAVLSSTADELSAIGRCRPYICDIADRNGVYALGKTIQADMGTVSILVNNAGIVKAAPLNQLADETIEKILEVNLTAQFWTCKAFLPAMIAQNKGHVVNVASAGGILALPNLSAYCASKFGVVGFTDALRQEMKKQKVNVGLTVVCPNTVGTGMFEGSKMVAGTRLLDPEDVATKIVAGIRKNRAMVAIPSLPVKILTPLTKVLLPIGLMDRLNQMLGMWAANDTWTGRKEEGSDSSSVLKKRKRPVIKRAIQVIAMLVVLNVLLTGINILQNGIGGWDGRSMQQVLGVPPRLATVADVEQLSKSEVMQLYHAAAVPDMSDLKGEYQAKNLSVGIMAPAAEFYTNHFFGPGRWMGKGFTAQDTRSGDGYNLFRVENGDGTIIRTRRMKTFIDTSVFDEKLSFHLDYGPFNGGLVHGMRDEIRKINHTLFIGMGYMPIGGGSINPGPFVVHGTPGPWVEPEK
ncbi:MAG: SDR family NAD(P)-dependent oxidoreductase [Desulfosarcina sp.]|nr:SDR family NAD(P)-dependent oxidoreductase [Desulfosarcina sp.]MBC2744166.1 SDR family NAD(P)-dependent oxidoreductase [Desulfosarcina sp.]MBC2767075.1 SDR family NAD(P)-dependent oxidoreductase [Desulfosarcina sp.]